MAKAPKIRKNSARTGIEMAIEAAGSQAELARVMKVGRQAVNYWYKCKRVPPAPALEIERRLGVHRHYLNPEVYPERPAKAVGLVSGTPQIN